MLAGLAVMAVVIMTMAWPGNRTPIQPAPQAVEVGTAPKGWINEP
jgi:hypothetical protein